MNIESELLNRHRDGDPKATEELTLLLLPLVKEYRRRQRRKIPRRIESEELESVMHLELCEAVDRLKHNEKSTEDVEQYIRNELKHSWKHCMRENSEDLFPPKGEKEIGPTRRVRFRKNCEIDGSGQPTDLIDFVDPASIREDVEDREDLVDRKEIEALAAVAETERERQVTEALLMEGDPQMMQKLHGVNHTQIKAILKRLRERATKQAAKSTKSQVRPRPVSPQSSQSKVTGDTIGDSESACFQGSFDDRNLSPYENIDFSKQTHTLLLISPTSSHFSPAEVPCISE